jgi:hypothetical protein
VALAVEYLPHQPKALSSNSSTAKIEREKEKVQFQQLGQKKIFQGKKTM